MGVKVAIYRVALHTAVAALVQGTAQGGLSAGITAYTIPKIDEYLKEQGFDKEIRDITLLGPYQQALVRLLVVILQVLLTMWGRCSGII